MDARLLAVMVPLGVVALTFAPTLTPPDRIPLDEAVDGTGPMRLVGVVATMREGPGRTHLLIEDGTAVWVTVLGDPGVAPGDRIALTARLDGGILVADEATVDVLHETGVRLLREVARSPGEREGNVAVEATLAEVHETVAYLKDAGHRLRVEPGRADWPPDRDRGARVLATGRLVYDATEMRYVLMLDGMQDA